MPDDPYFEQVTSRSDAKYSKEDVKPHSNGNSTLSRVTFHSSAHHEHDKSKNKHICEELTHYFICLFLSDVVSNLSKFHFYSVIRPSRRARAITASWSFDQSFLISISNWLFLVGLLDHKISKLVNLTINFIFN